jgi:hypothetical protein
MLQGATIIIKGSTRATTTDESGNFQIEANNNAVLVIKMIGYQTKEIPLSNQLYLNIELSQQVDALEEVVVVGYGTTKRKN